MNTAEIPIGKDYEIIDGIFIHISHVMISYGSIWIRLTERHKLANAFYLSRLDSENIIISGGFLILESDYPLTVIKEGIVFGSLNIQEIEKTAHYERKKYNIESRTKAAQA